ncbi:hypothetical protein [Clostridium sp.]|uniref:hypothetical protein n=1 Tax=Clostridium sp. TaxID=1506 RepID=UPI002FC95D08
MNYVQATKEQKEMILNNARFMINDNLEKSIKELEYHISELERIRDIVDRKHYAILNNEIERAKETLDLLVEIKKIKLIYHM